VLATFQGQPTPLSLPARSCGLIHGLSKVAWGSPASILLGTVVHTGSRLGTRRNSTNMTGEEAGQPLAVRVGHKRVGMARRRLVGSHRAPSMASSMVRRGPRGAG
jgi:hypothetical protein